MKLVHLADMQLGFRRYERQTPSGINQREADVANAFRKAIDKTIDLQPDLVLIAGDVFHSVRPTNPAILHAYKQFSRLVEMLPDADIVIISGNHDTPRTTETGCILGLFSGLGRIQVVTNEPRRISLRDGKLSILAVPYGVKPRPKLEPDPQARYNILLLHDEVEGVIERFGSIAEGETGDLTLAEIGPERWSYVALGHYHVYHEVAPNAFYSGSLDYASTNVWGDCEDERTKTIRGKRLVDDDLGTGKGFIESDLETGAHEFHRIKLARRIINLPELSGAGLTSADLDAAIVRTIETCPGGIDDQIVRLVIRDVPRHVLRDLDHRAIRDYKRRALHFLLDTRRPQPLRLEASGSPGRRASLTETVHAMLEKRELTPGIDRAALVELGLRYLADADRVASMSIGEIE